MAQQRSKSFPADLVGSRVQGLQEYAPEPLAETARRLGMPVGSLIKADANENPYGPTARALRVLREFDQYHRYPDPISRRLAERIGDYVGVPDGHILVGNGSDELIDLILRLFRPDAEGNGISEVIDCPPTFGMYAFYGATNDMRVVEIPAMPAMLWISTISQRCAPVIRDRGCYSRLRPTIPMASCYPAMSWKGCWPCRSWWCWMRPISSSPAPPAPPGYPDMTT